MRKKALRISVAAALIASMMSVPAYAESAVVTGNGVNMRSGPGTNYRVIDSCREGQLSMSATDPTAHGTRWIITAAAVSCPPLI